VAVLSAAFTVTVDSTGPKNYLGSVRKHLADRRSLLRAVGASMQANVADTFEAQRDPMTGAPWRKTSKFTLGMRPGGGVGGQTLRDNSALLNSIVNATPTVTGETVTIGSNLPYARIHDEGGTIKASKRFLAIPNNRKAKLAGGPLRWAAKFGSTKPLEIMFGGKGPFAYGTPTAAGKRVRKAREKRKQAIASAKESGDKQAMERAKKTAVKPLARKEELEVIYWLKREVKIPQRRYLALGPKQIDKIMADILIGIDRAIAAENAAAAAVTT
jgi:phage gpG-like protein